MNSPPKFLVDREKVEQDETFLPQQSSRKGELIAWGSAILIALALIIYYVRIREIQFLTLGMFLFFLASGFLISFGIWMDARTSVKISFDRLHYKSPLRDVNLSWDDLYSLRASNAGQVWKITVTGSEGYFSFRVFDGAIPETNPRGFLVLPEGDRLVRLICGMAELSSAKSEGEDWLCLNSRSAKSIASPQG